MASALCFVAAAPCAAASCSVESSTTTASTGLRRGLHSARVAAVVQPARSLSCGSSLAGTALQSRVCNKSVRPAGVERGTAAAVVRAVAAERVVEALEPSQTSTDQVLFFPVPSCSLSLDYLLSCSTLCFSLSLVVFLGVWASFELQFVWVLSHCQYATCVSSFLEKLVHFSFSSPAHHGSLFETSEVLHGTVGGRLSPLWPQPSIRFRAYSK
jgi:hypothetical protein